jgi:hypothetical protein
MKQSNQLNLTLSDEARRVLDEIENETGLPDQAVFKALIRALIRSWAVTKEFRTPIYIVSQDTFKTIGKTEDASEGTGRDTMPEDIKKANDALAQAGPVSPARMHASDMRRLKRQMLAQDGDTPKELRDRFAEEQAKRESRTNAKLTKRSRK